MFHRSIPILVVLVVLHLGRAVAQQPGQIWYFGDHAGLDFTGGNPVALNDGMSYGLDCSAACDDGNGQLNFYSNGMDIYNRNHAVMTNGDGVGVSVSSGQCVLIVPQPQSNLFYVFTVGQWNSANGFRYSIVDMDLQGGLGEVTVKNVLLFAPSTERIAMTYDALNDRFWVVTHAWNNANFVSYELTAAGLNSVPVVSTVGSVHTGGSPNGYNAAGQLSISPDGSRLACGIYSLGRFELFDFNVGTGAVSNVRVIGGHGEAWGTAFSPNSNLLYLTEWYGSDIFQVDATIANPSTSEIVVGTVNVSGTYKVGYLELGPDDRLYAAKFGQSSLAVIQNPNLAGVACGFVDNGVMLGSGLSQAGVCRAISYRSCSASVGPDQVACFGDSANLSFIGNDFTGWVSQSDPSQILSTELSFMVAPNVNTTYLAISGCDTLGVNVTVDSIPNIWLGNDTLLCAGETLMLSALADNASYLWQDNSTDALFMVGQEGTYEVTASNQCGSDADTVEVNYLSPPTMDLGNDTVLCLGQSMVFAVAADSATYLWQDGSTDSTFTAMQPGIYHVWSGNLCGTDADSLEVNPLEPPTVFLGSDTLLCEGETLMLSALADNASYLWQDNSTDALFMVGQEGTYEVTASNQCGSDADTVEVNFLNCDTITFPLIIPNIITPDGDGVNDTFYIDELPPNSELCIYNRWGLRIFQSENYANNWSADNISDGTYFYILRLPSESRMHGYLTILR